MRSLRSLGAALVMCAVAGSAQSQLLWDGIVHVPGAPGTQPGEYQVCPPGTHLQIDHRLCVSGILLPTPKGAPKVMSLQQALDMHFKAPAGTRAQAVGPTEFFERGGIDKDRLGIAYKLVNE